MKLALLQMNPTVGAVEQNADALLALAGRAAAHGATLALAPELALAGYPPRDLLDRPGFLEAAARASARVATEAPRDLTLIFGTVGKNQKSTGRRLTNEARVVRNGQVLARAVKRLLPSYDVFDETRYFEPGAEDTIVEVAGTRVFVTICEDAWAESPLIDFEYPEDPLDGLTVERADLLVNLSASPFTLSKLSERPRLFSTIAKEHRVPVALVNQVGGNDELIFDGRSAVWNAEGTLLARGRMFDEDLLLVDLSGGGPTEDEISSAPAAATKALVLGIRDYTRKCGFSRAVIGLSGGIDSAVTATLAAEALGPSNVLGVSMPSRYSSEGSRHDARALADNLKIPYRVVDIDPVFSAYLESLEPLLDELSRPREGDVTLENIQARIRGATLMAISNRTGALVLTTGNKSELAVGYCTLYGDMVGGLAVISDVPKTMVYDIATYLNREGDKIPDSTIKKPPSAELRPDQKDEDSLPPYPILDRVLELYVEQTLGRDEIVARGFAADIVDRILSLVRTSEYKRRQMAPGLIITRKAFGPGRRMPIAQGYDGR